jgi:hypothetical protein
MPSRSMRRASDDPLDAAAPLRWDKDPVRKVLD